MRKHIRRGAGDEQFEDLYERCSRCNTWNRWDRTPRGGRFSSSRTNTGTDSVTGKTIYSLKPWETGCMFCGSPAWDGFAKKRTTIRVG
jgi:hypothetical protein